VLFPVGRLPNAEPDCQTLSLQCVVSRQGAADSLVQHSQAVVRERLTVHLGPPHEKAAADAPQRRLLRDNDDLQKVTQTVRCNLPSRHSAPRCSHYRSDSKQLSTECIFYFGGPE